MEQFPELEPPAQATPAMEACGPLETRQNARALGVGNRADGRRWDRKMGEEKVWVCPGPEIPMHPSAGAQVAPESGLPSFRWVGERMGRGGAVAAGANAPTIPGGWGLRVPPPQEFQILQGKTQGTQLNFSFTLPTNTFLVEVFPERCTGHT